MTDDQENESQAAFDTVRPPGVSMSLAIIILQIVTYGISANIVATEYVGLDVRGGYILTMLAAALLFPANLMINFGRPQALKFIRFGSLFFAALTAPSLFLSNKPIVWLMLPIISGVLAFLISKSQRYLQFVGFYKIIWERHRESKR